MSQAMMRLWGLTVGILHVPHGGRGGVGTLRAAEWSWMNSCIMGVGRGGQARGLGLPIVRYKSSLCRWFVKEHCMRGYGFLEW
ncbi:hypothetical protein QJS10_CPB11g00101 [Acorus calamus]|uniref:Secreted protein n=1 Tax=Acorus calamus TaxID=4465 RepID=A0AAV9DVZ7_ACOCL|nr:hypothetical protein QJS10_CPB11g00101 [Acorus calamus]